MRTYALAACLLLVFGTTTAQADYAETERRLKAAGVDPDLRAKIHQAIDRGVAYLIGIQDRSGSFRSTRHKGNRHGADALCALALRHAGTPKARDAAKRALRLVVGPNGADPAKVRSRTYEAGIVAMLLMTDRRHPKLAARIAQGLVFNQDASTGWWGYRVTDPRGTASRPQLDRVNLSTTQFAALGLWAAARNGAEVPRKTWRTHLASLVRTQTTSGSWTYGPREGAAAGYPNGTMMAAANFALAAKACGDTLCKDPVFYRKFLAARLRMLDAVRRDGQAMLATGPSKIPSPHSDYYGLYALEKACLFLGLKRLGSVFWYRAGAMTLLRLQNKDGGWGRNGTVPSGGHRSAPVDTAFALLFLLRSSEVYRPTTPSPIDRRRVVTGGDPKKPFR